MDPVRRSSSVPVDNPPYVGAMLRAVWQWIRDEINAGLVTAGYEDLTPAQVNLFRYPSLEGLRPSEVAAQVQLSKQSVNDLLGQLEARGYIAREPDPADGRGRIVRLTEKGRTLELTTNREAGNAERKIAARLGAERFTVLRDALEELTRDLGETAPAD